MIHAEFAIREKHSPLSGKRPDERKCSSFCQASSAAKLPKGLAGPFGHRHPDLGEGVYDVRYASEALTSNT